MQYTKVIYGYMAFAGFGIFFVLVGTIALQLIVKAQIPLDAFSFVFMLYNFSVSSEIHCSLHSTNTLRLHEQQMCHVDF